MSSSDAGLAFTSMPAVDPSRHVAPGKGTQTHSRGFVVIGSVGPTDAVTEPASRVAASWVAAPPVCEAASADLPPVELPLGAAVPPVSLLHAVTQQTNPENRNSAETRIPAILNKRVCKRQFG